MMKQPQCRGCAAAMSTLLIVIAILIREVTSINMNGNHYVISNAPDYNTTYTSEFFDLYSHPIKTRYSEVYWTLQDPIPLPPDIVKRFENKVMAIVGYEVDQVKTLADGTDVSLPITHAYNHHYCSWLVNSRTTKMIQVNQQKQQKLNLHTSSHAGHDGNVWMPQTRTTNQDEYPHSQFFSEGNGGEFRKSYHGYPQGYAQLIYAPNVFRFQPMQIDTWNRNQGSSATFLPGAPLPQSAHDGRQNLPYSPLLECPCSNRLERVYQMTYRAMPPTSEHQQPCPTEDIIENQTECIEAVQYIVSSNVYQTMVIDDNNRTTWPVGCSFQQHANGTVHIYWNNNNSRKHKNNSTTRRKQQVLSRNNTTSSASSSTTTVAFASSPILNTTVHADHSNDTVTITLVISDNDKTIPWWGIGFGASSMCLHMQSDECATGGPYAIIVFPHDDAASLHVMERKLDFHGPGILLEPMIQVISNTVFQQSNDNNKIRTIVLQRSFQGKTKNHYTFSATSSSSSIPIIFAKGCPSSSSSTLKRHCGHGTTQLNFVRAEIITSACRNGIEGTLGGAKFVDRNRCAPFPQSDLQVQQNPTCSIKTYRGGLRCCLHGQSLLDKEQTNPWPNQFLEYRIKYRFYFQEYYKQQEMTQSHDNLVRIYWVTEANAGEYDIVPCSRRRRSEDCIQTITSRRKLHELVGPPPSPNMTHVDLIYAAPHCHAPSCHSVELYNADTGQLICHVKPIYGQSDTLVFQERGYAAIPPCLWSRHDDDQALAKPHRLSLDTTLLSIKRNNSTMPHTGEMAQWQMRGVFVVADNDKKENGGKVNNIMNERVTQSG